MDYKLNYKLYAILNGYYTISVGGKKYKIVYPSLEVKYKAEELYVEILESGKFDTEYLTDPQVNAILKHYGVWSDEMEERLDFCKKTVEEMKLDLYKQYKDKDKRKEIKKNLENLKNTTEQLLKNKHSLDYLKLDYFANSIKNQYIISQRILHENGDNVFDPDYNNLDTPLLSKFLKSIEEKTISAQDIREIVKGELWSSYTVQDNVFGPSIEMNDDQRNLLILERMYNNVKQHPECPSDEIINDDDALDGWFLFQKEKRKKEQIKNNVLDKVRGKVSKHNELYVFTQDPEEAKVIHDMNNLEGKRTIAAVAATTKQKGHVPWQDIPIVRQQLIDEKTKDSAR